MENNLEPALYIVSTPIGNLEDITLRAIRVLQNCDIIACEDTRHSGLLLQKLNILHKSLISYYDYNESEKSVEIIKMISDGKSVCLISDAGTPLISDPGYKLVNEAITNNIKVVPIPGVSALITALSASGLSVYNFTFVGFAPQKKGRKTFLTNICKLETTIILYESCHRIEKLLAELFEIFGDERKICIARELTKFYEEFLRGTVSEIREIISKRKGLKGELVVILDAKKN